MSQVRSLLEIMCKYLLTNFVNTFIFSIFAIYDLSLKAILVFN